jgi:hypothetical protein
MGYYMRFFDTSPPPLTVEAIEVALKEIDPAYHIEIAKDARIPQGDLYFGDAIYGEIEINQPGDGVFDEELDEMLEFLEESEGAGRARVEAVLRSAQRTVVVRVLWQTRDTESTMIRIDPLWDRLFIEREGLLQADGEGYYDDDELILAVK